MKKRPTEVGLISTGRKSLRRFSDVVILEMQEPCHRTSAALLLACLRVDEKRTNSIRLNNNNQSPL